jgi:hypothetical protein
MLSNFGHPYWKTKKIIMLVTDSGTVENSTLKSPVIPMGHHSRVEN